LESPDSDRLVKPADVRKSFGIAASTVRLWDHTGVLKAARRTRGGHRRYWLSEVRALVAELDEVAA
jgi:DNA-binding transcriptional MerR regulator